MNLSRNTGYEGKSGSGQICYELQDHDDEDTP